VSDARTARPGPTTQPDAPPEATGQGGPTLTRRASLNALAALVDYAARIIIQLVLAPLMLRFLGVTGFGIWQVLQRLIGHATPANGRPSEALKWVVAQQQGSGDVRTKRAQVGTALAVWLLFLPALGVVGGALAWVSPALVHASSGHATEVRVAAAVLVLNLMVLGVGSVPQSVLQGENLGYRRLGLSTAILGVGALLTVLALRSGWGLVGVAAATCVATALSGLTYLQIVRSQVPWWGISRPAPRAVRGFLGISSWFLLWNLVMQAIKSSDVIVLGAFGGVALVTTYALTSYVPQAVSDTVFMMISATMPGLAGLIGSGERERAARIRAETIALCWLLAVAAGAVVIAWLPWFVSLWVGKQYDAGTLPTVLIILMVLQLALIRVDSNVIDLTLRIRGKVLLGLLSVALSAGLGALLVGPAGLGLPGLVAGFMAGRLPLSIAYPVLVGRLLGLGVRSQALAAVRPLLATVVLVAAAIVLRGMVEAGSWLTLVPLGLVSTAASLLAAYLGGLNRHQRRRIRSRMRKVVGRT